ncbi:MAG: DUF3052 domain-containing protein [Reichenbachiella sp.]|uniref:DUF3052 domain-containing protein n=1 Tax=Reichenbachiella sp. TaxID=2184521 RepID=UPI00326344EB
MNAGYSTTPLAKKLGIKSSAKIFLINAPEHYFDLFSDWPVNTEIVEEPAPESVDFIHIFCQKKEDLLNGNGYIKYLKKNGLLWISWIKLSSKMPSCFKENDIRDYFLAAGLVDVKVAAVDKDWSGLKFVYRLEDR